ncbi:S-adenosyl-L-methionine-dependent methyltransferase [Lepidopterella palustris CBS 459.81]|uniref:S-adenosyl-L-methionine-dependent methyltransferase n=1 Tax=Lepidopterella palustris CBS 459.81 TaxID=1314670 RepID=A0A8E2E7G2_9PEZI|nr:S-adenosyl-L-methionine-dependent methyltransferase [Lepidopterella palustris CBS 459.81]
MAENIFEGAASFDWENYLNCRPNYRQSDFYPLIWDYHTSHGGQWNLARDVGTGPGNVAEVLSTKFAKVEGSDPSAFHIEVAKRKCIELPNVSFAVSRAEDVVATTKADLITVAECLPLMDIERAMGNFSELLKPGGTLAIWFYGGPIYIDAGDEEIQALHRTITSLSYDEIKPRKGNAWSTIGSWFDNVELPEKIWTDVKRIKWNSDKPLGFSDEFQNDAASCVRPDEVVEEKIDRSFWDKEVDFRWAKSFIDAQIPRQKSYITLEVETMYDQMEKLMAGRVHKITWPVVLILATKK